MNISVLDNNWDAHSTIVFLIVATLITDVFLEQFLIRTAVQWGEHRRQRTVMDTSLTDVIEVHRTITTI